MSVKVTFTGAKEIDDVLKQLPKALHHSVMQNANADAGKILVEKEKLLAPEGPTGHLVDSIGIVKTALKKATEIGEVKIGPRRGRYKGNHAHLVEYGTKKRRTKRGWANRGVMPKHPFVKPAFDQTKAQVEQRIATSTAKIVLRTMKKYLK